MTGAKGISFRLAANEIPTLVVVSPGKISSNGRKLSIHVPESAQSPDGVTYAGLQDIVSTIGGKYKKHKLMQRHGLQEGRAQAQHQALLPQQRRRRRWHRHGQGRRSLQEEVELSAHF